MNAAIADSHNLGKHQIFWTLDIYFHYEICFSLEDYLCSQGLGGYVDFENSPYICCQLGIPCTDSSPSCHDFSMNLSGGNTRKT